MTEKLPLPRVVLIDLSSLFWTAWHATKDKPTSEAAYLASSAVRRCFKHGDLVAVCCDSGRSFRKELLPEYKANRPERGDASYDQLRRLKEALTADGMLLWESDGFEADDVIATACEAAIHLGHEVLICSADKDLLQLVEHNDEATVRQLRTHNWKEWGVDEVVAEFGVAPHLLGDWLALVGDTSDNIRGARGVGPKTATGLLQKWLTLDDLWRNLQIYPSSVSTPAIVKSLQDNKADVMLARQLVALKREVPFDFRDIYKERRTTPRSPEMALEGNIPFMEDPTVDFDDKAISGPPPRAQVAAPPQVAPVSTPAPSVTQTPEAGAVRLEPAPAPPPEPTSPKAEDAAAGAAPVSAGPTLPSSMPEDQATNGTSALAVQEKAPASSVAETALVVTYERALEPKSGNGALALAAHLAESRLYTRIGNADAILAVIMRGRELGLGATTALDVFHVIEGKPAPHAHLIIALAEESPDCEYFMMTAESATSCTYETKHRKHPKPISHTFTIQDAVDAGYCALEMVPRTAPPGDKDKRGQWDKSRRKMLRKTCGVELARIVYPRQAMGLVAFEELGGEVE